MRRGFWATRIDGFFRLPLPSVSLVPSFAAACRGSGRFAGMRSFVDLPFLPYDLGQVPTTVCIWTARAVHLLGGRRD